MNRWMFNSQLALAAVNGLIIAHAVLNAGSGRFALTLLGNGFCIWLSLKAAGRALSDEIKEAAEGLTPDAPEDQKDPSEPTNR